MKINKNIFITCLSVCVFYVLFFYIIFGLQYNTILYSLIHAIMASIILHTTFHYMRNLFSYECVSISEFTILVSGIYFYISSVKYCEKYLYKGFIDDNIIRLTGSFITFVSIMISILLHKKNYIIFKNNCKLKINNKISSLIIFIYLIYNLYIFLNDDTAFAYERVYSVSIHDQIEILISNLFMYLCIILISNKFNTKSVYCWIEFFMFTLIFTIKSLGTGSRSALIYPVFSVIFGMMYFKKISLNTVQNIVLSIPFFYIVLTILIFNTSGRVANVSTSYLVHDISYRFDLSDFPMTMINSGRFFSFNIRPIIEGFKMAVPSVLGVDKSTISSTADFYNHIGLISNLDYTDSFFSMGAESFGIFGLLLFFPLIVSLFSKVENNINTISSDIKYIYIFFFLSIMARIEIEWIHFISSVRNCIIQIIFATLIYRFIKNINFKEDNRHESTIYL